MFDSLRDPLAQPSLCLTVEPASPIPLSCLRPTPTAPLTHTQQKTCACLLQLWGGHRGCGHCPLAPGAEGVFRAQLAWLTCSAAGRILGCRGSTCMVYLRSLAQVAGDSASPRTPCHPSRGTLFLRDHSFLWWAWVAKAWHGEQNLTWETSIVFLIIFSNSLVQTISSRPFLLIFFHS